MGLFVSSRDFILPHVSLASIPLVSILLLALQLVYRSFLHPLRSVPGPWICGWTSLWLHYHAWAGTQCSAIQALHKRYGPVVRIAPNDVDIADGGALWRIYMDQGGFKKSTYYNTFDIDGHATIFTTLALEQRAARLKAIQPIFSGAAIAGARDIIVACAEQMVARMMDEKKKGTAVDILNLARSYAIDAVSSYVLRSPYNGLEEKHSELSAGAFVDYFVGMSRFYHLSQSWCSLIEKLQDIIIPDHKTRSSAETVDAFLRRTVEDKINRLAAGKPDDSYPTRLLEYGLSKAEAIAECKDVVFAGTDSTGNNLATIVWYLVALPKEYEKLRQELKRNEQAGAELQSLPHLTGIIKEALRLSMAISTRLPRVVPPGGFYQNGIFIPEGANVGVSAYQLHLNPEVFPEQDQFLPDRWKEATPEMQRDWLPFGKGARGCIARNLAMLELYVATERIVSSGVLEGAETVTSKIESLEWFNSRVKGGSIELVWPEYQ